MVWLLGSWQGKGKVCRSGKGMSRDMNPNGKPVVTWGSACNDIWYRCPARSVEPAYDIPSGACQCQEYNCGNEGKGYKSKRAGLESGWVCSASRCGSQKHHCWYMEWSLSPIQAAGMCKSPAKCGDTLEHAEHLPGCCQSFVKKMEINKVKE